MFDSFPVFSEMFIRSLDVTQENESLTNVSPCQQIPINLVLCMLICSKALKR